jgi:hypothetical protein
VVEPVRSVTRTVTDTVVTGSSAPSSAIQTRPVKALEKFLDQMCGSLVEVEVEHQ